MSMHLEAIDNDLWYVVKNGVPSVTPSLITTDVKRFKQLDSQAKNSSSILPIAQMATYDILRLRVELLESLHIDNIQRRCD